MKNNLFRRKKQIINSHKRRIRKLKILGRKPFALPAATFVLLVLAVVVGYFALTKITSGKPIHGNTQLVIISYDKKQQVFPAEPQTVGHLLHKLNIKINQGDVVEPETTTKILQDNFRINIYRAVPVQVITDGGVPQFSYSAATTPRSIATQAGVKVFPEDSVTAQPVTNFLKQGSVGEQVVVNRSLPVNLNLYGTAAPTRTLAKTVGGLLAEKHVKLIGGATVTPAPTTPLIASMQIFVLAQGVSIVTEQQTVAMPTQEIKDGNLTLGSRAVRQAGSPGQQLVTYQVKVDPATGKEISRDVIQTVVTVSPVTQIVVIGTNVNIPHDKISIMQGAGVSSGDYGYVDYIISHESGWCATKAQGRYGGCPGYSGSVPSSGGYGLCQSTPPGKMASAGGDWRYNPVTQLRWCTGYADGRYGSWSGAYNHWLSHHNW